MQLIQQTGKLYAPLINGIARTYAIYPFDFRLLVRAFSPPSKAIVLSFFSAIRNGHETVRIQLKGPHSFQTYDFRVTSEWRRFEFVLENAIDLSPVEVAIASANPLKRQAEIGLLLFQLEKGKVASPPINGDVPLPSIATKESGPGPTRGAVKVHLKLQSNSYSATHVIVFQTTAETWQYEDDAFLVFWRLKDSKKGIEICFGISGQHGARFVVRVREGNKTIWRPSRQVAGKQKYAASIVFDQGNAAFAIDGFEVLHLQFPADLEFDVVSMTAEDCGGPGMLVQLTLSYEVPLNFFSIVGMLNKNCPEVVEAAYNLISKHLTYSISGEDENLVFNTVLQEEGFDALLRELRFSLPKVLQQYQAGSSFVEANIRDWVFAHISRPQTILGREDYTNVGRSDLVLTYHSKVTDCRKKYHVEFKIWGRAGYKKLPSQPIKYQAPDEFFSVVVLVDRRKSPNIEDFKEIVLKCEDYPCAGIAVVPLLEGGLKYFLSFHKDANCSHLRMVLNIHLCIPGPLN